jgi:hypothetical protein
VTGNGFNDTYFVPRKKKVTFIKPRASPTGSLPERWRARNRCGGQGKNSREQVRSKNDVSGRGKGALME